MTKSGWSLVVLLAAMTLWTLLAWGASGVLAWLPSLTGLAPPLAGLLSLVPQALLESWLPLLQQLGDWLTSYFPQLITWAGYLVWLVWGLGMLALLLLGALARRILLSDTPDKLPPRA
ncbi:hypothetical protein ACIP8G_15800 [Serratia liquefaciens]|uniref:hypothetical protein n=1 Tax=Serratia liquefaciens TaxID=614 RepID=UPI00380D9E7E